MQAVRSVPHPAIVRGVPPAKAGSAVVFLLPLKKVR